MAFGDSPGIAWQWMWDAFNVPWQTLICLEVTQKPVFFITWKVCNVGIDMLSIYVASAMCTLFWRKDFQLFITKILCYHSWHCNSTVNINCLVYDMWPQFTSFKIGFYLIDLNHFTLLLWRKLHYFFDLGISRIYWSPLTSIAAQIKLHHSHHITNIESYGYSWVAMPRKIVIWLSLVFIWSPLKEICNAKTSWFHFKGCSKSC